mgnify:CR=1 FL=1
MEGSFVDGLAVATLVGAEDVGTRVSAEVVVPDIVSALDNSEGAVVTVTRG